MDLKGKRITSKLLGDWLNWKFEQLEIKDVYVYEVVRTHFNQDQYEGGAARQYIKFRSTKDVNNTGYFLCFYTLKEIQNHIKAGFNLYLKTGRNFILSELELDLKR